jgi:hypothetical protein
MQLTEFIYRPFAEADDSQQASLFNGLAQSLLEGCK